MWWSFLIKCMGKKHQFIVVVVVVVAIQIAITYLCVSVSIACKMCWCALEWTIPRICSILHENYSFNYDGRRISRNWKTTNFVCPQTRRSVGRCSFAHTELKKWYCCSRHEIDVVKRIYIYIYCWRFLLQFLMSRQTYLVYIIFKFEWLATHLASNVVSLLCLCFIQLSFFIHCSLHRYVGNEWEKWQIHRVFVWVCVLSACQ